MKKTLFALLAIAAVALTSCSKDQRINRKLDGKWNATVLEGDIVQSPYSVKYEFSRDKKGKGTGTMTASYSGLGFSTPFIYEIKDEKLTIITDTSGVTVDITDYSRKKMVFVNVSSGKSTTLEKED